MLQCLVMFISCCYLLVACNSFQSVTDSSLQKKTKKAITLTTTEKEAWYFSDFESDSISGANITRAHDFIKNKKKEKVIVAVLDLEVNINHKDLKGRVWINTDEIPNNGIDDDNNGNRCTSP